MKEATGELNLTVITVVAIAAIAALVYTFIWPLIQRSITTNTCQAAYGEEYEAKSTTVDGKKTWQCCQKDTQTCVDLK